ARQLSWPPPTFGATMGAWPAGPRPTRWSSRRRAAARRIASGDPSAISGGSSRGQRAWRSSREFDAGWTSIHERATVAALPRRLGRRSRRPSGAAVLLLRVRLVVLEPAHHRPVRAR